MRVNECRVSVRDVRGSAPRRRSDASLTPCRSVTPRCAPRCALRAERCPEMRRKNIHKSNLAIARTSEMSEIRPTCPEIRPACRDSRRVPEIRVACPRFALQRHRVITNLPTFFFFSPLEIPSFFGTLIEIYILYYIYIYILHFNTPPVFRPA